MKSYKIIVAYEVKARDLPGAFKKLRTVLEDRNGRRVISCRYGAAYNGKAEVGLREDRLAERGGADV